MQTSVLNYIKTLLLIALMSVTFTADGQVDSIFRYSPNERLLKLCYASEAYLYGFDSAKAARTFDTIIDFGEHNNDTRFAWYARYFKLIYTGRQYHDAKKEIAYMLGMKDWIAKCPLPVLEAVYKHALGNLLFFDKQYGEGFNMMLLAQESFEGLGLDNIPDVGQYIYELGNDYYNFGDYNNSIKYTRLGEKYTTYLPKFNISRLNTEALAYTKLNDLQNANTSFKKAIVLAKQQNDTIWTGIVSGNYGFALMLQHNYIDAINYLLTDYDINNKTDPGGTITTTQRLADCYTKTGQPGKAKFFIDQSLRFIGSSADNNFNKNYYGNLFNYYSATGNYLLATKYADSFMVMNDSITTRFRMNMLSSTQNRVETENYLTSLSLAEERQKDSLARKNIIIILVSVILALMLFLLYLRFRSEQKDKKLSLQQHQLLKLEKTATEERLHHAEEQLALYIKNVSEKNDLMRKAHEGLEELQQTNKNPASTERLQALSNLLNFTILTDEDWKEFKELFDRVHPLFFMSIKNNYPQLTPAETRLLALMKLKLSHKEMSAMIGVSADTITKSKYRLRKKLQDINIDAELEQFVQEL